MPHSEVPVLIVGGSLVGLSTALLLGHHGVRSLVVEHHRGTAIHPRAAQVTQRSMEIFRTVGVEQIVRQRSSEQFVQDGAIMAVESLTGRELAYFVANLNEGIRDVSPCERVFISQSLLEPVLRERAEALGATLRFATDMASFEQDGSGVTATIRDRDSDRTGTVRARYMVAADGAHSQVRSRLGVATRGRGTFSKSVTIYFRADVAPLLRGRNLSVIYVNHPVLRGFIRVEKPFDRGFLAINALGDPARPQTDVSTGLTEARCIELVRTALGASDLPVAIDNVMPWDAEANVAERMQDGRVFITGDAAHAMPPNGGFGGNTGIQDAHNLAWKLAFMLNGLASPDLLSTYETERRPVAAFTTEQAYARYVTRTAPFLGMDGVSPVVDDLNVELGYSYSSTAVCADSGELPVHGNPRQWKGRPGTRAPHVWLYRKDERISALDLFGSGFVLLAASGGTAWCEGARRAADNARVPLDVQRIGDELRDPESSFASAYGLSETGMVLVRPDGFVGMRAPENAGDVAACQQAVSRALATLTGRNSG